MSRENLEEDAAYITPIGQDADGNFVYAPEDKEVLVRLEQERMRSVLERKRQQQQQQQRRWSREGLGSSWRRFPFFGQENGGEAGPAMEGDGDPEDFHDNKNEEENGVRRSTLSSSSPNKVCGCCSLRVMIVVGMILLTLLLLGLALIVTRPMWMPHPGPPQGPPGPGLPQGPPTGETNSNNNNGQSNGGEQDDMGDDVVVATPGFGIEVDSSEYTYATDDIVVSFTKNETYMHDFVGIYQDLEDEHDDAAQEPLLSKRCCGSQGCFKASDLSSSVTFGTTTSTGDRVESWPLPVGRYRARLYQIRDGKRTVRLLAQTSEPFEVVPDEDGRGPTLAPKPQYGIFPYLGLANKQLREKILTGEEEDRFVMESSAAVPYADDWIGVYRTTSTPVSGTASASTEEEDQEEQDEPALWFYRCGYQDCFEVKSFNSIVFDQFSTEVHQEEAWPLSWGTYQVKMQREYGTLLVSSNPKLIVVYPGGSASSLYHDKMVYEEGESFYVYFNNGFRDGAPGAGNPDNPKTKNRPASGVTIQEWIGVFRSEDNINEATTLPLFFLYSCTPPESCGFPPYNGRVLFSAETVADWSVLGKWPLTPGSYKTAMIRGAFPWDLHYGNYTRIVARNIAARSLDVFEVV